MSFFSGVEMPPPIEVFHLHLRYYRDKSPEKLNLAIGGYRTNEGKPWVLPVVKSVDKLLANDETLDKEHFPLLGPDHFSNPATKMILGENSCALNEKRAFGIETLAGAGALRLGAEFLFRILGSRVLYYSEPTWGNHILLFKSAGFQEGRTYRYWSEQNKNFDFNGMLEDIGRAPERSVIILQSSAHNPTGTDPSPEQWEQIAQVIKARKLFPFFDSALQGFASGDLDEDAASVRYFEKQGFEFFCAQSFSKNMGLYSERIGNLVIVLNNHKKVDAVKFQMATILNSLYSTPPSHGAMIVSRILNDDKLFQQWKDNLKTMYTRLNLMRKLLRETLENLRTPGDWSHLTLQKGMSCGTGLNKAQAELMVDKHHMYMLSSGRINIAAITPSNVEAVAQAIHKTVTAIPNGILT